MKEVNCNRSPGAVGRNLGILLSFPLSPSKQQFFMPFTHLMYSCYNSFCSVYERERQKCGAESVRAECLPWDIPTALFAYLKLNVGVLFSARMEQQDCVTLSWEGLKKPGKIKKSVASQKFGMSKGRQDSPWAKVEPGSQGGQWECLRLPLSLQWDDQHILGRNHPLLDRGHLEEVAGASLGAHRGSGAVCVGIENSVVLPCL